jgi:hypothetical protein
MSTPDTSGAGGLTPDQAAQLTPQQVDERAAAIAAADEPIVADPLASPLPGETTLAYGAEGESVTKLVNLLAVLGYVTNDVIKGGPPKLDESVLADVRAAQEALAVEVSDVTLPVDIPVGVEGELVGTATWAALYGAAAAKLEEPAAS